MNLLRRLLRWLAKARNAFTQWLNETQDDGTTTRFEAGVGAPTKLLEADTPRTEERVIAEPRFSTETSDTIRYSKRPTLLFNAESALFSTLLKAIGHEYQIFAKVRLADVMKVQNEPADRKHYYNKIQCKHFDFVLCHFRSHEPLLAIELDGSSHSKFDTRESDEFKERVCKEVGLPLLRIKVGGRYSTEEIARLVHAQISTAIPPSQM